MSKFKIGAHVKYDGPNKTLSQLLEIGLTVIDSIPRGMPVGNGETNSGGETLYRCRSNYSGVIWLFRESELWAPA